MNSAALLLFLALPIAAAQPAIPSASAPAAPATLSAHPIVIASNPHGLTPADIQELQSARQAALKAHPELQQEAAQISQRMRAFQQKIDAEIIRVDPTTATVVARIEGGMHPSPLAVTARPSSPASR